jgi:DNA-binding transcriptional LysR family regulator
MNFDQLEMLEAVVLKGNYKSASEHLHKSQPSLSVGIKKLEEEFDLVLFDRSEYRSQLTDQGRIFYQWAQESLESFRNLKVIAHEMGELHSEPTIHIVLDPLVEFSRIRGIFETCLGPKSPTELKMRSEILGKGLELILSGEAHFSIGTMSGSHPEIESFLFQKIEMLPVAIKNISGSYKNFPQVVVMSPETSGGLSKGPKCYVSDHSMKTKLILNGFGWGRLGKHEIEHELKSKKLMAIKDSHVKKVEFNLYAMRNKNFPMGPLAKKIWSELKK